MKKMGWKEVYFQSKIPMLDLTIFIFALLIATVIIAGVIGGITGVILTNL
tara:strand:+ start:458 stop:607 length:150 start_codon:yes stop_codon:yes gene_type:complete